MTMPNFLIVGAPKSGTTALYEYLGQHPEVYMSPVKEPKFFALEGSDLDFRGPGDREANRFSVTSIEGYKALFDAVCCETAIGEASPLYLYYSGAPARIKQYVPEAKLIAILRNPAERAYSQFLHLIRDGREPLDDFGLALWQEEARIRDNWAFGWHYKQVGFYCDQLKRYFETFDENQLKVYLYEDLEGNPAGVLKDLFRFLDVDDTFTPNTSVRPNVAGVPRNRSLHALHEFLIKPHPLKSALKPVLPSHLSRRAVKRLTNAVRSRNLIKPPFPEEAREHLVDVYREDVLQLQELIQRDLSGWLR